MRVKCPRQFTIWNNINALFKRIVHSLEVEPSTKQIGRWHVCKRAKRASCKKKKSLSSHIFQHVYILFSTFLNFLDLFHFQRIIRKQSGFLGIREISFKVETLPSSITGELPLQRMFIESFHCHILTGHCYILHESCPLWYNERFPQMIACGSLENTS